MHKPAVVDAEDGVPPEVVLKKIRVPFIQRAILRRGEQQEEAFVVDLGLDGVFLERREPLPKDERVQVEFRLPGNDLAVVAGCRVAWWHSVGVPLRSRALPAGVGLHFIDVSEDDRRRLRAYLVAYCRRQPKARQFLRPWPEGEEES